ncbi:MAG: hypothetical protein EOM40_08890 [Clostridia bacterium]|nr:hypothetical protein [Clostridia bacterium]NCC43009.1 hypothetical protein [Clostridia bacterium]
MTGITADGYNLDFILQNLQEFMGAGMLWYVFPVLMILVLFAKRKEYRIIGIYPYLIFTVTVCNPYLITLAGKVIGLSDRYYRFFWILPCGIMIGIICAMAVDKVKWKAAKILIGVAVAAIVVVLGEPVYFSAESPGYKWKDNSYYTPDYIINVSEEFHKDGIEHPTVVYSDSMVYEMCQYDFDIISIFTRDEIPRIYPTSADVLTQAVENNDYTMIVKYMYLLSSEGWVTPEKFAEALQETGTDYIVLSEEQSGILEFYEESGCVISGNTDGYYILRTATAG